MTIESKRRQCYVVISSEVEKSEKEEMFPLLTLGQHDKRSKIVVNMTKE